MSHTDRARIYRDVRLSNVPEGARAIAAQESSQTTRLYDRSGDKITLDEIKRIRF